MNKAVIYARYSSLRQNEESIEQQVSECNKFAQDNGYTVIAVYSDEAISGRTDKRPEFQKMIRHAEQHRFNTVIAYKSNRISRNMLQAMMYEGRLNNAGVELVYAKEMFGNNAAGRFALRSMMNLNQFYSENLGEDVKRAMRMNALECKANSGVLPYGYKKGKDNHFEINEEQAVIVQEVFERYSNKESPSSIVKDLNHRGIRTQRGKLFTVQTIWRMINCRTYTGLYHWSDIEIEGGVPVIIEKPLFDLCQNQVGTSKRKSSDDWNVADYILSGKLFCGHCGEKMVGQAATSHTKRTYNYYTCYSVIKKKGCTKKRIQKDRIESLVVQTIVNTLLTDSMIEDIVKQAIEYQKHDETSIKLNNARNDLIKTENDINAFMDIIKRGEWTSSMKAELVKLEEKKTQLEGYIEELASAPTSFSADEVRTYLKGLKDLCRSPYFEKQLISIFVNAIYLYDDKIDIFYAHEPNTKESISLKDARIMGSHGVTCGLPLMICANLHVFTVNI